MTPGERLYREIDSAAHAFGLGVEKKVPWDTAGPTTKSVYELAAKNLDIKAPPRVEGMYWVRSRRPGSPTIAGRWLGAQWYFFGSPHGEREEEFEVIAGPLCPPK